jgi:hypothetical protein
MDYLQQEYQKRLDAGHRLAERQKELEEYLNVMVTEALLNKVPGLRLPFAETSTSGRLKISHQSVAHAVQEMLEYCEVMEALLDVLEQSNCQTVEHLRAVIADKYASVWAGPIAEAEAGL